MSKNLLEIMQMQVQESQAKLAAQRMMETPQLLEYLCAYLSGVHLSQLCATDDPSEMRRCKDRIEAILSMEAAIQTLAIPPEPEDEEEDD